MYGTSVKLSLSLAAVKQSTSLCPPPPLRSHHALAYSTITHTPNSGQQFAMHDSYETGSCFTLICLLSFRQDVSAIGSIQ